MKNIHGGDIYQYNNILDFSANINPLGAPESVNRAITDAHRANWSLSGNVQRQPAKSHWRDVSYRQQSDHLRQWSGGRDLSVCSMR